MSAVKYLTTTRPEPPGQLACAPPPPPEPPPPVFAEPALPDALPPPPPPEPPAPVTLESGVTIKTINGNSVIGSGDIVITGTGEVNVQADWNQADNAQDDYIKNKPTILTYSQMFSLVSLRV